MKFSSINFQFLNNFQCRNFEIKKLKIMPSPYQEFVRKAKERFAENQKKKLLPRGGMEFTAHARYKMTQYGLSEQKVRGIIHHPKRTEVGVMPQAVAMMQPVSPKIIDGKEIWKQEIWVMFLRQSSKSKKQSTKNSNQKPGNLLSAQRLRIVSAWRYPGVSPKRSPVPREILQELEEGDILEEVNNL
jgi:hypothetical protein